MRWNVPLLPVSVSIERRRLGPCRWRTSLRASLVAVLLLALAFAGAARVLRERWSRRCLEMARNFKLMALEESGTPACLVNEGLPTEEITRRREEKVRAKRRGEHYAQLYRKYTQAAAHAWSAIPPDPPPPE